MGRVVQNAHDRQSYQTDSGTCVDSELLGLRVVCFGQASSPVEALDAPGIRGVMKGPSQETLCRVTDSRPQRTANAQSIPFCYHIILLLWNRQYFVCSLPSLWPTPLVPVCEEVFLFYFPSSFLDPFGRASFCLAQKLMLFLKTKWSKQKQTLLGNELKFPLCLLHRLFQLIIPTKRER